MLTRAVSVNLLTHFAAVSDPVGRQHLFMALWTLKESVVKAKGTGINAPPGLQGFSVGKTPVISPHGNVSGALAECLTQGKVLFKAFSVVSIF